MTDIPDGLQADPRRRASAAIRGFHYQFWRTVQAWIDLDPEDVLFVEGAEDFDRIGVDEATAVQVKDDRASGPLTLSGVKGLGALGNFWRLVEDNRGRKIRFQFITTAEAGSESDGFEGCKGVELWNLCARSPLDACSNDVARIRDFLLKKKSLDAGLFKFLEDASVSTIRRELVEPFEWLYDQPMLIDLREIVIGRLLELGRQRGVTARDAGRLANELYMIVVDAAIKRTPQALRLIGFFEQLDQAVNIQIPREALRLGGVPTEAINRLVAGGLETGEGDLPALTEIPDTFEAPVLARKVWPRRDLIERVGSALAAGIAFVDGSAGMGKTTLVRQAVEGREHLLWAGLRDRTIKESVEICRRLAQRVASGPAAPTVVLDDLNPEGDLRTLEQPLGRLAVAVTACRGGLVVISYRPAGPRLASILGLSNASRVSVPTFEEDEIREFMMAEGCPLPRADQLSRVVWLQTAGHSQLVATRVDALKAASFPMPTSSDILEQPKEIQDARAEALHVVRAVLSEDARNLLYRLSLAIPVLKRSHALRIGGANPPIPRAGEVFDRLVGPWLEQPVPDRYRVSALVSSAGRGALAPDEVKQVHAQIATALLAERKLSVSEFSGVIAHALSGGAEAQLAIAARVFMTASKNIKERLAKDLSWIARAGVGPSTHLLLDNVPVRQWFRLFQWEVAGLAAPDYLEPLATAMESDFAGDTDDPGAVLMRLMYLAKLLLQLDYPLSPDRIVAYILELWHLAARANSQGVSIDSMFPPMYPGRGRPIFADMFMAVLIPRIRKVEDLYALVSALDSLDTGSRDRLLGGIKTDDGELRLLFNGPWVSMNRAAEASFEDYASALESALSAGRRWQHHAWMRASARALSAILDEMLHRPEEARQIVKATTQEVGSSTNLDDQLAVIAFNSKEYGTALETWQRILPGWDADKLVYDLQPIFSTRSAAIAAADLGKWDIAAHLFGDAIERSADLDMRPWRVGLLGDKGYALWRGGDHRGAVAAFSEAVEALEEMPNRPESFSEYAVQKLVGHTLASLSVKDGRLAMPIPGMCSNLAPSEAIRELPPAPTVQAWFLVYELAREAGDDDSALACAERFRDAPFAFLRAFAARDALERRLKGANLEGVVRLATATAIEMGKSTQRKSTPTQEPDPPGLTAELTEGSVTTFIRPTLWSAIMRARVLGLSIAELVANWRREIDPVQPYLADEVSLCGRQSSMAVGELGAILKDTQEADKRRMLAAVLLLGRDDSLLQNVLYAQVTIMDVAADREFLQDIAGESLDTLVRRDWLRFCENPFMLRSPGLYVNAIREACGSRVVGWSPAARVILAALPTVELAVPAGLQRRIEEIANRSSVRNLAG